MEWRDAASQMLRAVRGRRSQLAFSRRLGYRSNVACEWEAGRRLPTGAEALRACARVGIDVDGAVRAFAPAAAPSLREKNGAWRVDRWLSELLGGTAIGELASRSGYSRYAVSRFLRGRAQPRLDALLALIEAITARASDLVAALVPIAQVPALHAVHLQRSAAKRVAFDAPWSEGALRVLETTGYRALARHEPGFVARRLGLTLAQEQALLASLERAGILRRQDQRYADLLPLTVDTSSAAPEDIARLKAHWTSVALERLSAPRRDDWFGYNVVSVAHADVARIRDVLRSAYREIRAIAAASEPPETAALLNLQLMIWDE